MSCLAIVQGEVIRVTELDDCGVPLYGTGSYVVSEGFTSVAVSADNEAGDEFVVKNAAGRLCINERTQDSLKRFNLTIDFCEVDFDLFTLVSGFSPVTEGGETVGFRAAEGQYDANWGLEVWGNVAGGACGDGGVCYGYFLFPFVTNAALGDYTIENSNVTFQITNAYTQANSGWGYGWTPVLGTEDDPEYLADAITPVDHSHFQRTCLPAPVAQCGEQDLPGSPPSPPSPTSPTSP